MQLRLFYLPRWWNGRHRGLHLACWLDTGCPVGMKELICKNCGAGREIGRRICAECNRERLRALARQKPRYTFSLICVACHDAYEAWRKEQQLCSSCYALQVELASRTKNTNKYLMTNVPEHTQHRDIAEENRNMDVFINTWTYRESS